MSEKDSPKDEWLKNYHSRLQSENDLSMHKKDTLTKWSLTILLATIGLYFGEFVGITGFESESRFALLIGSLIIQIQFFVNSMLAYGFLKKWRSIKEKIEQYWMDGAPEYSEIVQDIKNYDHGRNTKPSAKDMIWAQLRAGYMLIFAAHLILAVLESQRADTFSYYHGLSLGALGLFLSWQIIIYLKYDQFKRPVENSEINKQTN